MPYIRSNITLKAVLIPKYMENNKQGIKADDLINFSTLSTLLTSRADVIRKNRIQKKHKKKIESLITLINYWLSTSHNE